MNIQISLNLSICFFYEKTTLRLSEARVVFRFYLSQRLFFPARVVFPFCKRLADAKQTQGLRCSLSFAGKSKKEKQLAVATVFPCRESVVVFSR
jgi:hypothetical protein